MEHGADRLASSPSLDRRRLRQTRNSISLLQHRRLDTFPVPTLTEQNKTDLTRCAEDILLTREHYFPATIAEMYNPDRMDTEFPLVREVHDRNDEVLERIYIGRRFKTTPSGWKNFLSCIPK